MKIDVNMHMTLDEGPELAAGFTNALVGCVAICAEEEGYVLNDTGVVLTDEGKGEVLVTFCMELAKKGEG